MRTCSRLLAAALLASACGTPAVESELVVTTSHSIINGTRDTGDVPVVAIDIGSGALCTGTLVAARWVLTAGHCTVDEYRGRTLAASMFRVGFGYDVNSSQTRWLNVSAVYTHPQFDLQTIVNDIALLQLASDAPAGVVPVPPLPASLALAGADVGATVRFVGFGTTSGYGDSSGVKYQVSAPIGNVCASASGCRYLGTTVSPRTICFNQQPGGPCSGDSGGPAFFSRNGTVYVAGVTSYGDETCEQLGCSTKVDAFEAFWRPYLEGTAGGGSTGGGSTGPCASGLSCEDASGQGDYACIDPDSGVPAGAASCSASQACAAGFSCWATAAGASTGVCLQDCDGSGGSTGGGGTTGPAGLGQPCAQTGCATGLLCVGTSETDAACRATCTPSAASCPAGYQCATLSSGGGACIPGGSTGGGGTTTPATEGQACSQVGCATGLVCVGTSTTAPVCRRTCNPASPACPTGYQCTALSGASGACVPGSGGGTGGGTGGGSGTLLEEGAACQQTSQCQATLACVPDAGTASHCRATCADTAECPIGAACALSGGVKVCLATSVSDDTDDDVSVRDRSRGGCASAGGAGLPGVLALALVLRPRRARA